MDPFNCHPNNETPAWDTNAEFPCIGCHTMGNDIANIGHFTDPDGLVTLDKDDTANMDGFTQGLLGNCTWCHFAGHPTDDVGGAAIILPNNPQVGISYKSGGIHLRRDPGNLGRAGAPYATQAELCWGCHDANNVSEWGADDGIPNTATNPIVNPGVNYNYGTLSNGTAPFQTSDWTTAQWTSGTPAFAYKSGKIQSTHSTNLADGHSDITWNASASQWEETTDEVANIQCHNCHDVHNMNFADGDTMNGNPYLRGSWVRNPYPEDGAPLITSTYNPENEFMEVPRGGTMYNNPGGYQIDQNNFASGEPPTKGLSVGNSAGICMLCHSANGVDGMDMTADNGVTGLWIGGQDRNGHSNAALGGTADDLITTNILSYAIRNPLVTPPSPFTQFNDGADPNMGYANVAADGSTTTRVSGFRSAYNGKGYGVLPQVDGSYYAYVDFDWGVTQAILGIDKGYHSFTCSKCHNPHASRLPKLMITNCLDTKHNTWDDNRPSGGLSGGDAGGSNSVTGGDNDGVVISQAGSAQNCHRLGSGEATGGTGDGWNNVTPWSVKPPGSL
jgi:nitrate/TMAO reductase-like tetraheme cytochrome c subunit